MAKETIFADGFSFKRQDNAPDFVVGRLSIKVEDAKKFFDTYHKNGWVNLNVKTARSGNYYLELDTFEPQKNGGEVKASATKPEYKEEVPF